MAGKTISGAVFTTVTLGSAAYPSPLTITSTGRIAPSVYGSVGILLPSLGTLASIVNQGAVLAMEGGYGRTGGAGGNGIDLNSPAVLTNSGVIAAGVGGYSNYTGGIGGTGLDVQASSTILNSGQIFGGTGGYGFYTPGIAGGGVVLDGSATLSNTGAILGGTGGRSNAYNVYAYRTITGGIGVSTGSEAVVSNSGHITGGAGGYTYESSSYRVVGSSGAAGVALGAASTLSNGGTITGGLGGVDGVATYTIQGGNGGDGADLAGATATNTGLIAGGGGNYGFLDGGNGGAGVYVSAYGGFTNKGNVVGGAGGISNVRYGGAGGIGLAVSSYATATNSGHITGGAGGAGGTEAFFGDGGLQGGAGVYVLGGKLINTATITGGAGATTPGDIYNNGTHHDNGGEGGAGVQLGGYFTSSGISNLSAINYGLVRGGVGGGIISFEGTAASGGFGAFVTDGVFTNHGTIFGGGGGDVGQGASSYIFSGVGGVGVEVQGGASLLNTGTIQGGTGGATIYSGTIGGAGVVIAGGTFTDSGVVRGGYGGVSQGPQAARGDAIYVGGSIGGTLILNAGAVLVGNVVAHVPAYSFPAVKDVLEVAGSSATPLAGFGTQITGFNVIGFAPGAVRTIEGTFGSGTDILGFAPHDSIVLDGFAAIAADTSIHAPYLELANAGASISLDLSLAQSKDLIITDAGGKTTIASAVASTSYTIGSNMAQLVASGGGATGSVIKAGGEVTINQGGTALHPTIAGGTLQLEIGALTSGGIGFSTVTGGKLILDSVKMPAATISGFIAGDTIQLAGVVYNSNDTVTVATAGVVTVKTPGGNYNLDIAGAKVGESDFHFGAGSLLTRSTANAVAMTFLSPRDALVEPGVFGHGVGDMPMLAEADWFGAARTGFEPAGGSGFTVPTAPVLAQGIGQAFTISGDVKLEALGLGHHSGWFG